MKSKKNGKTGSDEAGKQQIRSLRDKVKRLQYIQKLDKLSENISAPSQLFKDLLDLIIRSVNAEAGSILLVERRTGELLFRVARGGAGDILVEKEVVIREGIACWVATHRRGQIVNHPDRDKRFNRKIDAEFAYKTRNIICVPMISKGRVVGVVEAINRKGGDFDRGDLSKLKDLAGRVAISVENALLYEDIQRRIDEASTLYRISKAFVESLDVRNTLNTAMELLKQTMKVSRCAILLYPDEEKQSGNMEIAASRNLTMTDFEYIQKAVKLNYQNYLDEDSRGCFVPSFENDSGKREFFFLEPLMVEARLYGVFVATRPQAYYFLPQRDDYKILYVISSLIAQTLYIAETIRNLDYMKRFNEDILRTLTEGVMVVDQGGRIISINQEGRKLLGCDDNVCGMSIRDYLSGGMVSVIIEGLESTTTFNTEKSGTVNGRHRVFDISVSAMMTTQKEVGNCVVAFRDITEIKEMEEKARRTERLSALGEMASGVAHEVRNPLQSVRGFVQLLQVDISSASEYLPIILSEVDRLNDIVEGFLGFARPVKPAPVSVEVSEFLSGIVEFLRRRDDESSIEWNCLGEMSVMVDKSQLKQVLLNIGMNGLQAMKEKPGTLEISGKIAGNTGVISVKDQGCGISPANLRKLFNPFFTTKSDGTGLGLAVSHRIIKENNGDITVKSLEGQGTEFRIILPLAENCESSGKKT